MVVPTYTHDLVDWIADADTSAWSELTGATSGGPPDEADTESALQGTNSTSQSQNTTSACSLIRIMSGSMHFQSDHVAVVLAGHGVSTALNSYATNGFAVCFANTLSNWKGYTVAGNDTPPYPYGKWISHAVFPAYNSDTYDLSGGTPPTGSTAIYGVGVYSQLGSAVAKGQPFLCDMIRYGRADAIFYNGDVSTPATISGFSGSNDLLANRWGLIQQTTGGYLWKGLLSLGKSGSPVYFDDKNKNIFVQDTRKVYPSFNRIEVNDASSTVIMDGINFVCSSPSTTTSRGDLVVVDDATVNLDNCTFTDMRNFTFKPSSDIVSTTFRRTGSVVQGTGSFDACTFANITESKAILSDYPSKINGCTFVGSLNHAIELTAACAGSSFSFNNHIFTNYTTTDGSTGSEVVYNNSAGSVTLNCSGNTGTISVRNGTNAYTTLIIDPVTTGITVTDLSTGSPLQFARVLIWVTNNDNYFYQAGVSVTGTGTTATVSHTSHGLATGDNVIIRGITNDDVYNGAFQVTVTDGNTYTYTTPATITEASPAGTHTSTFAVINGDTDSSGYVFDTRSWDNAQAISGRVRKSTAGSALYQQGSITGTISATSGFSTTIQLVGDE